MNKSGHIGYGYSPLLDCHSWHISHKFATIQMKINQCAGKELKAEPKFPKSEDPALFLRSPRGTQGSLTLQTVPNCAVIFLNFVVSVCDLCKIP